MVPNRPLRHRFVPNFTTQQKFAALQHLLAKSAGTAGSPCISEWNTSPRTWALFCFAPHQNEVRWSCSELLETRLRFFPNFVDRVELELTWCNIIPRKFHLHNTFYQNTRLENRSIAGGKSMGPCARARCNHSKICHWRVGWLTVTETNLGAQAATNTKDEDKQQPSIYLLSSCHKQ